MIKRRQPLFARLSHTRSVRTLFLVATIAAFTGCANWFAPPPGIGREVAWSRLPGWEKDRHAAAWPALLKTCEKLSVRD